MLPIFNGCWTMIHPVSAALSSMADLLSRTLHAISLQSPGRCCRTWSPGASYWDTLLIAASLRHSPPSTFFPCEGCSRRRRESILATTYGSPHPRGRQDLSLIHISEPTRLGM